MAANSQTEHLNIIMGYIHGQHLQKLVCILLMGVILSGCALSIETLSTPEPVTPAPIIPIDITPSIIATEAVEIVATSTPEGLYQSMTLPDGLRDELPVMQGICYEAAHDAAGRTFILRSAEDHIRFYAQADESKLCRHPVTRESFDFSSGRVLVGFWQIGQGCTAHHEVLGMDRDEAAKKITLHVKFITEGACAYELVRPFWVSIADASDYDITIANE